MRRFVLGLLPLLLAGALRADDVRLKNGKTFAGVIATERGDMVDVQIPGGTLSLTKSSVLEIVRAESPYSQYLERAATLRRTGADARAWLLLARWAGEHELAGAAREAALEAAKLDPQLADLAPLMRGLGYEYDDTSERWLPLAEAMQNRGMVLADGQWMTKEEAADFYRGQAEAARDLRHQRDVESLQSAAAQMSLAAAEMAMTQANGANGYGYGGSGAYDYWYDGYVWPAAWYPGFFPNRPRFPDHRPPRGPHPTPHAANPQSGGGMKLDAVTRQPGSLFPAAGRPGAHPRVPHR
jgi:hypothetical protein